MSDDQQNITSISNLVRQAWFWITPLIGGVASYIVLCQRGLKPHAPRRVVAAALTTHCIVASFSGALLGIVAIALGHNVDVEVAAALGVGSYLGVQGMDLFIVILKVKTGVDIREMASKKIGAEKPEFKKSRKS